MNDPGWHSGLADVQPKPAAICATAARASDAPARRAPIAPAPPSGVRLSTSNRDRHRASERVRDGALVRAALLGDGRAAHAIVTRYMPLVRRCLGASFSGADLDDHVQEVFARCFSSLSRLRDPDALRSYLIGIALRWAASERRRCRLRWWEKVTATGELPDPGGAPDAPPIEVRQVAWRTRAILARLQPQSCRALELRFMEEQELTDVAKTLGVSLATAKRQLVTSIGRVRALAQAEPVVAEYVRGQGGSPWTVARHRTSRGHRQPPGPRPGRRGPIDDLSTAPR
jgi:RNA polymerase sigma-70 factor, ECF subfamily